MKQNNQSVIHDCTKCPFCDYSFIMHTRTKAINHIYENHVTKRRASNETK
jgi:hypothetical protein